MLQVKKISKNFGAAEALKEVSFAIPEGGLWALAGANGAGKTTMLRILCGAEEESDGRILWKNADLLADDALTRRTVALMPDVLPDAGDLSVFDYLDFHRRAFGRDREALRRAMDLCAIADAWQKRMLSELSRGMKQRVSLARMLLADPAIFLFDEPGAGLDPRGRLELRDLLRRLADAGRCVLVSSHVLAELQEFVDGVVILDAGRVAAGGHLDELFSQYDVPTLEKLYLKLTQKDASL